ncbi:TVP38/TMEM64 family protein [Lutispora sp.]|uniref:TVP38/TMEM64 family protein n=1 Tax=Lutispora sp. TaxID=2828727 RepID=UPI002B1F0DAB|nr:TVP38/TMEM64 family protein [Lutispora sp.]MEA4962636.1 TVP38/TMEM64 family protein [Lutispora sp.]
MKENKKGLYIKIGIILICAAIYFFVQPVKIGINQAWTMLRMLNVDVARNYILSFDIWAPIVSFLLMVFQSLIIPLPAFIITFANAGLFGWIRGAVLSWSSAMAGAALCFFIAKYYGRSVVEKLTSKFALDSIDVFFKKYGKFAILIARLLPFVSFDIVSYAAGLTSMSFWSFFWATGLGQLPATIVYSYVGDMLTGTVKTFVMGLLILFALSVLIFLIKQLWNEKNKGISKN